jgi:EAL domain-containing protein (putative c-di-GMP-specific phosphodiesterase class I)
MILVVDDHEPVADGLAEALHDEGYRVIVCYDAESAEVVVENAPITAIICDIRLTGSFRFEGLDFLEHAQRYAPSARVALISGNVTSDIREESLKRGADLVLAKPFAISDLEPLLAGSRNGSFPLQRVPLLQEMLVEGAMSTRYQSVYRLSDGTPIGLESLATVTVESFLNRPDLVFEYAERKRGITDLEIACVARAFEISTVLGDDLLFINVHPAVLADGSRLSDALFMSSQKHGIPLDRVVLEITEQAAIRWDDDLGRVVDTLRAQGLHFAFDDVGMAYSHLTLIERFLPRYLKVSQHFGTGFESDSTRLKLVRNILSLARDFHADLILEGIETAATLEAARVEGIPFGQGYYLARPKTREEIAGGRA